MAAYFWLRNASFQKSAADFLRCFASTILIILFLPACASKKKNLSEPLTQRTLRGKIIALAEVRGPKEARDLVEVALVNDIIDKGSLYIIDRPTVAEALATYPAENDRQRLGKKVGADYVLTLAIEEFKVVDRQGLDALEEEDSVMTEEWREKKPVVAKSYKKVRSSEGIVRLRFDFLDVGTGERAYAGIGEARETYNSRERDLPRKMQLLESLATQAVSDFFAKMPH